MACKIAFTKTHLLNTCNVGFDEVDGFYVGKFENILDTCLLSSGVGNLFSELSTFATLAVARLFIFAYHSLGIRNVHVRCSMLTPRSE